MNNPDIEQLKSDIKYIKDAITGTGLHKDKGIIDIQEKQQCQIDRINKFVWALSGGLIFLSTTIVVIYSMLTES